jgi:hypothetical protein
MKIQFFKSTPAKAHSVQVRIDAMKREDQQNSVFIKDQFSQLKKNRVAPPVRLFHL